MRKKLILISGSPCVGKTAAGTRLFESYDNSAYLDGDWCWCVHPFSVADRRLRNGDRSMSFVLSNYLNSDFEYVFFASVVLTDPEIREGILKGITAEEYETIGFTLTCSEETLKKRHDRRGDKGETNYYWLHLPPYPGDTVINTDGKSVRETVREMRRHIAACDTERKYICKAATEEEMIRKWDYEISLHAKKENWLIWKEEAIKNAKTGRSVPYYGILDGNIICEATANLYPDFRQEGGEKPTEPSAELCAFRTNREYRGKGYFSRLMDFIQEDLKKRGYNRAVVGVEPGEKRNREIYHHWGFTEYMGSATETYPDGTIIDVMFYGKQLK